MSIYTSLCIEINKGGKGRDGGKKTSSLRHAALPPPLCHWGRESNVGPCVTGPFQLKITKIQQPNNYVWNARSCVRCGQEAIPSNKLLVWVWTATRRPGRATKGRERCAGDEWHPPGGTERHKRPRAPPKSCPPAAAGGRVSLGALSTIWLPAGMIYGVRKAR